MTITVYGTPGAQGSKRHVGHGRMIEMSKKVGPWREAVAQAVMLAYPMGAREDPVLWRGAVSVHIVFSLARPKSAKKGAWPSGRVGDIDKLVRSTLDALTQVGVFEDDARVVELHAWKRYCGAGNALSPPGAVITVERAE